VVSEEGPSIAYDERRNWAQFWLVDPLDGTKEFVHKIDEFTVNIALINGNRPVAGVVYAPVLDVLYAGHVDEGCWQVNRGVRKSLHCSVPPSDRPVRIARSRFHASAALLEVLQRFAAYELITAGSSLKFCTVAAGTADLYARFNPTMEWDTAAGHAVLEAAGGVVVDPRGSPLVYNKPNLTNGPFFAAASLEWIQDKVIVASS
jgi:3'(2'), 5'-bisphosphate nucleotidase